MIFLLPLLLALIATLEIIIALPLMKGKIPPGLSGKEGEAYRLELKKGTIIRGQSFFLSGIMLLISALFVLLLSPFMTLAARSALSFILLLVSIIYPLLKRKQST